MQSLLSDPPKGLKPWDVCFLGEAREQGRERTPLPYNK